MAGTCVPTMVMIVPLIVVIELRIALVIAAPIEQAAILPMALVPAAFGLWNMLYVKLHGKHPDWKIGVHGALLPLMLVPLVGVCLVGLGLLRVIQGGVLWFEQIAIPYSFLVPWLALVMAVYYLVWRYLVNWLNGVLFDV